MDDEIRAWRWLADREARRLFRRLPAASGVQAEDLEAAALVALWRLLSEYDGRGTLRGYLGRVLPLRLCDWLRRSGSRHHKSGEPRFASVQLSQLSRPESRHARDLTARPCRELSRVDDRDEVAVLLRRFLPWERELLRLRYLEGLTLAEAGRRTGRTESAVCDRLKALARECGGG